MSLIKSNLSKENKQFRALQKKCREACKKVKVFYPSFFAHSKKTGYRLPYKKDMDTNDIVFKVPKEMMEAEKN